MLIKTRREGNGWVVLKLDDRVRTSWDCTVDIMISRYHDWLRPGKSVSVPGLTIVCQDVWQGVLYRTVQIVSSLFSLLIQTIHSKETYRQPTTTSLTLSELQTIFSELISARCGHSHGQSVAESSLREWLGICYQSEWRGETDVLIDLSPLQDFHTDLMTCSPVKLNQSQCWALIGQLPPHCAPIGWGFSLLILCWWQNLN